MKAGKDTVTAEVKDDGHVTVEVAAPQASHVSMYVRAGAETDVAVLVNGAWWGPRSEDLLLRIREHIEAGNLDAAVALTRGVS